ncbi:conjugal transfer protein traA, partial [mine drainage metagenome]
PLDLIDQSGNVLDKENRGNTPVALDYKKMANNVPVETRVRNTYTTTSILEAERTILGIVDESLAGPALAPKVDEAYIAEAIATKERRGGVMFSSEQLAFMRGTLSSGRSVELVRGVAGAGKTTQLEVVSSAFKRAGYSVIGCSPTGVAADNLRRGARIDSHTLASLALQVESNG